MPPTTHGGTTSTRHRRTPAVVALGRRCDEGRSLVADPAEHYLQLPAPAPVPVWVGGSSEAALRRAAHHADGWMPLFLSVDEYGDAVERLGKEVDGPGRAPDAVIPAMVLFVSIDGDRDRATTAGTEWMGSLYGIPPKAFERHLVAGTADEVAARWPSTGPSAPNTWPSTSPTTDPSTSSHA